MTGIFIFCDENAIPPLDVNNIDVTRYLAWLGDQDTVAADSLQPYLSAINKFLLDHGNPPVALGPMVSGVRKGLANCQKDLDPTPERLSLPASVALAIMEKAATSMMKESEKYIITRCWLMSIEKLTNCGCSFHGRIAQSEPRVLRASAETAGAA